MIDRLPAHLRPFLHQPPPDVWARMSHYARARWTRAHNAVMRGTYVPGPGQRPIPIDPAQRRPDPEPSKPAPKPVVIGRRAGPRPAEQTIGYVQDALSSGIAPDVVLADLGVERKSLRRLLIRHDRKDLAERFNRS